VLDEDVIVLAAGVACDAVAATKGGGGSWNTDNRQQTKTAESAGLFPLGGLSK